jgi:hypothetical protein
MNPTRQLPYTMLVAGLLLVAAFVLARRPYYNWDMFPYMAIIMANPGEPFVQTHQRVFEEARSQMPKDDFEAITARQPELREDPAAFHDILRYHTIKPGYTAVAKLLYTLGIHPLAATWLPSVGSYFLLGILLYSWSRKHAPAPAAALFTFVIALAPPLIDLARYSSPDMLCTLISAAGLALILSDKASWGIGLLTTAILVRPDAVLLLIPVVVVHAVRKTLPPWQAGAWLAAGVALTIYLFGDSGVVGEFTFMDYSAGDRLALIRQGLLILAASYTLPMVIVAVVILLVRRSSDLISLLVWAALLSIFVRYLLHPFIEDRFHLPAYLGILMATWQTISQRVFQLGASKS